MGFCLAGYVPGDRMPYAFQIEFDALTGPSHPVPLTFGTYRFWGVPNMIDRLIRGYDANIRQTIVGSPHWTGTESDYDSLIV